MLLLVFSAHPDDAESCVGGSILHSRSKGYKVLIVHMTAEPENRVEEAKKAAKILDVDVEFLGFKEGDIPVDKKSLEVVKEFIKKKNPDVIFTHWPLDFHPDHQTTGILVLRALNSLEGEIEAELYFYEACTGYQTYYFHPNVYFDITPYRELKKKAVFCHASQKPENWYRIHETMMKFRGMESGNLYAEALIKLAFRKKNVRDKIL